MGISRQEGDRRKKIGAVEKSLGRGRGCVFGSCPKWLERPDPELVHSWLLVHSSPYSLSDLIRQPVLALPHFRRYSFQTQCSCLLHIASFLTFYHFLSFIYKRERKERSRWSLRRGRVWNLRSRPEARFQIPAQDPEGSIFRPFSYT